MAENNDLLSGNALPFRLKQDFTLQIVSAGRRNGEILGRDISEGLHVKRLHAFKVLHRIIIGMDLWKRKSLHELTAYDIADKEENGHSR